MELALDNQYYYLLNAIYLSSLLLRGFQISLGKQPTLIKCLTLEIRLVVNEVDFDSGLLNKPL